MDLLSLHNAPDVISARTTAICETMLRESPHLRAANFTAIGTDDLAMLFRLYDERFFGGWLTQTVDGHAAGPLRFRLSSTMTKAGGKTTRTRVAGPAGSSRYYYDIAVASRMLFMNFGDIGAAGGAEREVTVCGLPCADRLHALMRVMEHEILHLAEMLAWGDSSCSRPRFKAMAANIFGHADTRHALVTPRERAAVKHDVHLGGTVEFDFEGRQLVGRVNRIHHRATVLVESPDGVRYSDGKTYRKYYVPLPMLRPRAAE